MKKLMNLRGATTLDVPLQNEIQGGYLAHHPSRFQPMQQIALCRSDIECPNGQICCLGNFGVAY